mgnify:CR=1 FL=1
MKNSCRTPKFERKRVKAYYWVGFCFEYAKYGHIRQQNGIMVLGDRVKNIGANKFIVK